MSDCRHKVGSFCALGHANKRPTPEFCQSCNDYDGKIRGAGDLVHIGLKSIGVNKLAKAYENKTGKQCKCGERRASLNKTLPRKTD